MVMARDSRHECAIRNCRQACTTVTESDAILRIRSSTVVRKNQCLILRLDVERR
jgi:hypothetical protein